MINDSLHPQVYPVEEDTWMLREAALAEVRPNDRVLEVGTGSGHIAASLAGRAEFVVALDINPHAARAARALGVETLRSDLLSAIRGPFDLVLFNPPYLPTAPDERLDDWLEYALDGGADGRETIARFMAELDPVLASKGRALLLVSSLTGVADVLGIADDANLCARVVRERTVEGGETLVVLRIERRSTHD